MTTQTLAAPRTWRVVDIVVAAVIAVTGGVIFWAWNQFTAVLSPLTVAFPATGGLYNGGWMIPAVLGMLIIRKPGAALLCETIAASGELILGSKYGLAVLGSGLMQGLGAELIFLLFFYRRFNLPVALLAGAAAGIFCAVNDTLLPWGWNIAYDAGSKLAYLIFSAVSGAVIAGGLSWLATRGLARAGALQPFASRKAAAEPAFR